VELLDAAKVPARHRAWAPAGGKARLLTGWDQRWEDCRRSIEEGATWALLGTPGTGKTQLAVEGIKQCCRNQKTALYTRAQEVFMAIRECYGQGATRRERDVLATFTRPHFLVIDDVHQRGHSDSENRLLFLILDTRYGALKPTVLIANTEPPDFRRQIGEAVFDRMSEGGRLYLCNWPSFRAGKGGAA
jgi:DNA replication protein DnaC